MATLSTRLVELESALGRQGIALRPALTIGAAGQAEVTRRTGIVLPAEVREWFRWWGGTPGADPTTAGPCITPRWRLLSLQGAIRWCEQGRRLAQQLSGVEAEQEAIWPADAFPIATGAGELFVRCGIDHDRAPVDVAFVHGERPAPTWIFDSMTEMVEHVLRLLAVGAVRADDTYPDQLVWDDWPLPPELRVGRFS